MRYKTLDLFCKATLRLTVLTASNCKFSNQGILKELTVNLYRLWRSNGTRITKFEGELN